MRAFRHRYADRGYHWHRYPQGIRQSGLQSVIMSDNVDTESFKNLVLLKELRVNHRDLDDLIDRLSHDPLVDQLRIRRLKKRRLMLKDMIARLESELIPDMDA